MENGGDAPHPLSEGGGEKHGVLAPIASAILMNILYGSRLLQGWAEAFQICFEQGEELVALQCLSRMKESEVPPPVPVAKVVESMQHHEMVTSDILCELKAYFKKYPIELNAGVVCDVLESPANRADVGLVAHITDVFCLMLPAADTQTNSRMHEVLVNVHSKRKSLEFMKSALEASAS